MADRGDAQPGLDGTPALELAQFSNDETMSTNTLPVTIQSERVLSIRRGFQEVRPGR